MTSTPPLRGSRGRCGAHRAGHRLVATNTLPKGRIQIECPPFPSPTSMASRSGIHAREQLRTCFADANQPASFAAKPVPCSGLGQWSSLELDASIALRSRSWASMNQSTYRAYSDSFVASLQDLGSEAGQTAEQQGTFGTGLLGGATHGANLAKRAPWWLVSACLRPTLRHGCGAQIKLRSVIRPHAIRDSGVAGASRSSPHTPGGPTRRSTLDLSAGHSESFRVGDARRSRAKCGADGRRDREGSNRCLDLCQAPRAEGCRRRPPVHNHGPRG